jgi:NAD(P)-dependent dehydrogenase (short-subunit alcohol dehydrogenase family)
MTHLFSVADQVVCITGSSRGLGKTLARAFAEHGAKVVLTSFNEPELQQTFAELREYLNNIMDGVVYDPDDPYQKRIIARTLMGRRGNLEEFIGPYLFLASKASSYVTGHILQVDGGYSCW